MHSEYRSLFFLPAGFVSSAVVLRLICELTILRSSLFLPFSSPPSLSPLSPFLLLSFTTCLITAGVAGFEHRKGKALMVDLLATSLTLAWVEDVLVAVVVPLPEETLGAEMKLKVLRAVNRILYVTTSICLRVPLGGHKLKDTDASTGLLTRLPSLSLLPPAAGSSRISSSDTTSEMTRKWLELPLESTEEDLLRLPRRSTLLSLPTLRQRPSSNRSPSWLLFWCWPRSLRIFGSFTSRIDLFSPL